MAKFIVKALTYLLITLAMVYAVAFFGGAYTDPFYRRFTSPKQSSLVVGTSRSAQGVVPEEINKILKPLGVSELYNYSFTIRSTPFGEPYYRSILKKLKAATERDVFIVTVDPWAVSTLQLEEEGGETRYLEKGYAPHNMVWVDKNPNPEYLFKNLENRLLVISRHFNHAGHSAVMDDGSLAVFYKRGQEEFKKVLPRKLTSYRNWSQTESLSQVRLQYLQKTVDTLSRRGVCMIVRLPVHPEMLAIEDSFMPGFDSLMSSVADPSGVPYLNFVREGERFPSTDGNHMTRAAAEEFSKMIGEEIRKRLQSAKGDQKGGTF